MLSLGIDAAWTLTEPSGVALLESSIHGAPRLIRVARSYGEFTDTPPAVSGWLEPPVDRPVSIHSVIAEADLLVGMLPQIVALDIPLATGPITGRRACDSAISRAYGVKWASTHSPSRSRPGAVSEALFSGLSGLRYHFATTNAPSGDRMTQRWFLETYPHPANIEMLGLEERLPYKVSRVRRYWPNMEPEARWHQVIMQLGILRDALTERIEGVADAIPEPAWVIEQGWRRRRKLLKGVEDALDAAVCAYVGMEFLRGRVTPYGDEEAAIWIPLDGSGR